MTDETSPAELDQIAGDQTGEEQSVPSTVKRLPEGQEHREADRLMDALLEAVVSVPDFRDKAPLAYAHGSERVEFTHGEKGYMFSRDGGRVSLKVGKPGASKYQSGGKWEEEIDIAIPWPPNRLESTVKFGSKDVYEVPFAAKPEIHNPQTNTVLAVQNIERRIQTLKSTQAPTPPPGPNSPAA